MKKAVSGFSIVEVLVSMVILSIVMMVMSNVIIVSSLEHSAASGRDDGEYVARQKLNQLQNPGLTIPTGGTATVNHKGLNYTLTWTLSSSSPILATVKAEWVQDGKSRKVEIAGYLEKSNVCADIGVSNTKPTIKLYLTDVTKTEITNGIVPLDHGTPGNKVVCRIYGVDPDTTKGDAVTYSLPSGVNNALFTLSGDTLKTKNNFNTANTDYTVKVQAVDCRGTAEATAEKEFVVHVGAPNDKPKAQSPQPFTVNENGTAVGTLVYDAGQSGLTWTSVSNAGFSVTNDGVLTANTRLDYESAQYYSFNANLRSSNSKDSTVVVNITVVNVNDTPTTVILSNNTLTTTAATATSVVGNLTAADQDVAPANADWYTHTFAIVGGADADKFVINNATKKLKVGASDLIAKEYTIIVKPTDAAGLTAVNGTQLTISVTPASGGVNCTGVNNFPVYNYVNNYTPYVMNAQVKYSNHLYKCLRDISNAQGTPDDVNLNTYWQDMGVCP